MNKLRVNDEATVTMDLLPETVRMAHYADGDVYLDVPGEGGQREMDCSVGMATAMALFRLQGGKAKGLQVWVSLERDLKDARRPLREENCWSAALGNSARLEIPDERMQFLYDAAVRTVVLLSAVDLVPGPYIYRRFWFRGACLMLHPLIVTGQLDRAERILSGFAERQSRDVYFQSQAGEWDSNGQVLWIAARFAEVSGRVLSQEMDQALVKAVDRLERKKLAKDADNSPGTRGLLPAGFSAEHLGPNDFYYRDDFWAWGGLLAAKFAAAAATLLATKATEAVLD